MRVYFPLCQLGSEYPGSLLHALCHLVGHYEIASLRGGMSACMRNNHLYSSQIQICWYLAAVVQVQLCKYFIEIGDSERESTVWGEINVLRSARLLCVYAVTVIDMYIRFAMLAYGHRSPIGSTYAPSIKFSDFSSTGEQHDRKVSCKV
jgi:hypothetical protein